MVYTPYLGAELPTIVDVTKRLDPEGKIDKIAEILTQYNPILEDIPFIEANQATGHIVTVRSDVPEPTWRKLNYGVRPTKSATTQITESLAILEDYGEVDKEIADINGNTAEFRMSEDAPHIEGISNSLATAIFYEDTAVNPERFTGLSPRFDVLGTPANKVAAVTNSDYLKHVISAGGTTAGAQTSLWLIVWGENTVFGVYPKGSTGGLLAEDLGEVTLYDNDGGRYQGYRSHYQWKAGLVVKDWRYVVRIANIELADMTDAAAQKNLYTCMIKALHTIPQHARSSAMFYTSAGVAAMLDLAAVEKGNAALGATEVFGKELTTFRQTPIRTCNAILETEAVVS